jgi:hypothetical protein
MLKLIIPLILTLLFIPNAFAMVHLASCQTDHLNISGQTYVLDNDISTDYWYCLWMGTNPSSSSTCDNIILDCQNHKITSTNVTGFITGLYVDSGNNVTVKNCEFYNWDRAFHIYNTTNSHFYNITIDAVTNIGKDWGIYIYGEYTTSANTKNTTFQNISILNYPNGGFYFEAYTQYLNFTNIRIDNTTSSFYFHCSGTEFDSHFFANNVKVTNSQNCFNSNARTFDNFYNSSLSCDYIFYLGDTLCGAGLDCYANVAVYNSILNASTAYSRTSNCYNAGTPLNTTLQTGRRPYPSPFTQIGGDYWTNPTATGYSDTCSENLSIGHGFCNPYAGNWGNDQLPYSPNPLAWNWTLAIDSNYAGCGYFTPPIGDHIYQNGDIANFSVSPLAGCSFNYWLIDGTDYYYTQSMSIMMLSNHTAIAYLVSTPTTTTTTPSTTTTTYHPPSIGGCRIIDCKSLTGFPMIIIRVLCEVANFFFCVPLFLGLLIIGLAVYRIWKKK